MPVTLCKKFCEQFYDLNFDNLVCGDAQFIGGVR